MRKGPIHCVRTPLHESFDEDIKRIKEERYPLQIKWKPLYFQFNELFSLIN